MHKYISGLQAKMLLALALGMLLLFALMFFVARTVLLEGYAKLEQDKTLIQISSAENLLKEQAEQLSFAVKDNAHWDDIYQYTQSRNPAFIKSSFNNATFANNKVNAIIIVSPEGKSIYQRSLDYNSGQPWHIPELLAQAVRKGGALIAPNKSNQSGLFWTPEGICIVSAFDILDSNEKGPRRGTLVMVRLLDQALIKHIEPILGAKLSVEAMRQDEIDSISLKLRQDKTAVIPVNDSLVAGFALIEAIGGDVKLVLSTAGDRKIFEQGKSSLKFLYWFSLLAILLLAAFGWLLNNLVLTRLAHLNENVKRVGKSSVTSNRIKTFTGKDEIASLSHGINNMLERLDEAQHALQFEKERAQVTLTSIADAVITSNSKGFVLYMNKAAERLTGVDADFASGKSLRTLFHLMAEDKTTVVDSAWLTDASSHHAEVVLERADGQEFVINKSASPLHDSSGVTFGTVTVLHDVTMLRAMSSQLSYQARYDELTGLVNRYEFDRKAQAAIDEAASGSHVHSLAYIDLDQFKIVNDSCGHMAGDVLLKELSLNLKAKLRGTDTLARLGGDEFALLLMGCGLDKAQEIVSGLLEVVQDYRFGCNDKVFKVGASIGLIEISPNHTYTLSDLISRVDSACYAAKGGGGNRIHVYQPDDMQLNNHNSQLQWVSRIHTALEHNQFVLYMQPLASLQKQGEAHCELLIRMLAEDGTLYPPGSFLPAAERYRLMSQIDRWVVAAALAAIVRKGADFKAVCAINLSGQSLSQDDFLDYVIGQIKLHEVDTQRLCFEITETAVITNLDKARQFMQALRNIGCRFSLDDFGSGLSSFAYLKNLEVDFLKIDGMFVKGIVHNKIDRAMVDSINNVGHVMGLHTIAEFAENDEIIQVLKEIGVDYAQGYGVAMPALFEQV
jgi:diguanylate cyclase (GGDEF)-like protein/PAS domain S-box-containing protein